MGNCSLLKKLHLYGTWKRTCLFLVNWVFVGTRPLACKAKRFLLRQIGVQIGNSTTIVGPIYPIGNLIIGDHCWIGRNMTVNGNGTVIIGDNCDIAPDVMFSTGGHVIGGGDDVQERERFIQ